MKTQIMLVMGVLLAFAGVRGGELAEMVAADVLRKESRCTSDGTLNRIDPGLVEVGRLATTVGAGGDKALPAGAARNLAWLDEESNPVGLVKTNLAGRAVNIATFLRNGKTWRFVWFQDERPVNELAFSSVDLSGVCGRMTAPTLVEMVTGRIFVLKNMKAVPLWNSPLLVAEKFNLPFATDWSKMTGAEIVDAWYKRHQRNAMKAFPTSMKGEAWLDWPAEKFLPCIDRYGQFKWRDWPGKVHDDAELKAAQAEEEKDLAAHPGPDDRDRFGGWTKGPRFEATGRFRTHRDEMGKWWLVDPDGQLFWSWGPVRVTPSSAMTPMNGDKDSVRIGYHLPDRDCFFEDLSLEKFWTTRDELLGPFYDVRGETRVYDLSSANLYRKYGDDYYARFAEQAHRRIRSWGMNTIANSSDVKICLMDRTPYAERVEVKGGVQISGSWGMWGKFRDPFAETFESDVVQALAQHGQEAHDKWCIGFFVDNEIQWGRKPEDLAVWTLWSRDDQPAKIAFLKRLAAKGIVYDGDYTKVPQVELAAFTEELCEEYFRRTRKAVKSFDSQLLYLGCRYSGAPPWSVKPCAKYCDVVSWNIYRDTIGDWRIPGGFDAPVLIGEFHFGATDRGPFGTGVRQAKDQNDRAAKMKAYVESALANPQIVGVHWHQFSDQAVTGRFDGEGLQVGFTDVCDQPYPEMRKALREVGQDLYQRRAVPMSAPRNTALEPRTKIEQDSYDWFDRHNRILRDKGKADVVFIGDSITHFWAGRNSIGGEDALPRWKKTFGAWKTLNLGYGWDRTGNVLWRLDHGELDGVDPQVVVLHIGGNNYSKTKHYPGNTAEEVAEAVLAIMKKIRAKAPRARIVTMGVFPFGEKPSSPHRVKAKKTNAILAEEVKKFGNAVFVDITDRQITGSNETYPKALANDFVHPTDAGYEIWASAIKPLFP